MRLMPLIQRVARHQFQRLGGKERWVRSGGADLLVHDLPGRGGPTVVLMHGLGSSSSSFSRLIPLLQPHVGRLLLHDLPGCGYSPMPNRPLDLTATVEVVEGVYSQLLGRERAVYVGNSLGGAMAGLLAIRRPETMSGLALVCSAGAQLPPQTLGALIDSFSLRSRSDGAGFVRRLYHRAPLGVPHLLAADMVDNFARPDVQALLRGDRPADHLDPDALRALPMPLLCLWGAGEKLLPAECWPWFQATLTQPTARVERMEGVGHVPQVERPDLLAARLVRFLREDVAAHAGRPTDADIRRGVVSPSPHSSSGDGT